MKHLNSSSFQARHLSDHLEEAKSRVKKEQDPEEHNAGEKIVEAEVLGDSQASDSVAVYDDSHSKSDDVPTYGESQNIDRAENESEDKVESVFSKQDREDMEQLANEEDQDNDGKWDRWERYDIVSWFYYVQEAERLWSPSERKESLDGQVCCVKWKSSSS